MNNMNNVTTPLLDISSYPAAKAQLRVSVVTETYPPEVNGVAMTLERLARGMQDRNHDIQVIRPRQSEDGAYGHRKTTDTQEVLTQGLPIPRYPQLKLGLPSKKLLTALWLQRRPDLVHIATEGPLGWSALKAARKLHIPVCTDFRTNFHSYARHYRVGWLQKPIMAYLRTFHNNAQCTMVPTLALHDDLSLLGFEHLVWVPRGIDKSQFHPMHRSTDLRTQWGADEDTPVALYVGRIATEKNLPLLVETFEAIRQSHPQWKCVVVGDGPAMADLATQAPWVHFAGVQCGHALAQHYASADLFVFPSMTETFGNVIPEAMASGLPVVCFDHAAGKQLITHGKTGVACTPHHTHTFVQAAVELAAHPQSRRHMGEAARQADTLKDWNDIVIQVEAVWHDLVGAQPLLKH